MPEINATSPVYNAGLSQSMSKANNRAFNFALQDYLMGRKPDYWVYLYTVSEQSFDVFRPPLLANLRIVAKPHGKEYAQCARFPQPLLTPQGSVDSDELTIMPMDTRRFVMDIINPDNLGLDQDSVIAQVTSIGNDLGKKGVFWSLNNPPKPEEIAAAVKRMEDYYKSLTERANTVQASSPKDLPDTLTPEHFKAAEYLEEHFGMQFSWHAKMVRLEACTLCGERVKSGVAFHRTEEGGICVRDWARTVKAGARTRAQAYDATGEEQFAPRIAASVPNSTYKKEIPEEK